MNNLGRGESMRLSELSGKEIVNLERAEKWGFRLCGFRG